MKNLYTVVVIVFLALMGHVSNAVAETIVVIVNKANQVSELTKADLNEIYRGKRNKWPNGKKINPVNLWVSDGARVTFFKKVLNESPNKAFPVAGSPKPFRTKIRKSAKAALVYVSRNESAIGYIPLNSADENVKKNVKVVYTIED